MWHAHLERGDFLAAARAASTQVHPLAKASCLAQQHAVYCVQVKTWIIWHQHGVSLLLSVSPSLSTAAAGLPDA